MNRENILAVADAIEKHSIPDLGFNMGDFIGKMKDMSGHKCGTSACVAGWADAVMRGRVAAVSDAVSTEDVAEWFGIGDQSADQLFFPRGYFGESEKFLPHHASSVLRHLAETGEVDWDRALAGPSK